MKSDDSPTATRLLLDTSAVIDPPDRTELSLDSESTISSITLAELSAGVNAAPDTKTRALRLARLQIVETTLACLPFTAEAARVYGLFYAMIQAAGRNPRPRRMDLLIAAVAAVNRVPLVTRNGSDFADLQEMLTVIALSGRPTPTPA